MRILVIGSGGREHAIVRALSGEAGSVHAAPGNPGIAAIAETHPDVAAVPDQILSLAGQLGPDLVVIGPEAPLVAGAADALRAAGFACFGPDAGPATIEGSKSFAKQVMAEAGIPTAASFTCRTGPEADAALAAFGPPYVVKDDALAAGKGVLVTADLAAARAHARACGTVVIEEYLDGPEISLFAVTDGATAVPLLPAQDFKRARDGDQGPNTGGMGAYAPLGWAPAGLAEQVTATVIQPAVDALARRGAPYRGLLYAGAGPDRGRPQGDRVQRPVRRPGDAGGAGPARHPPGAPPARRRHRRPGRFGPAAMAPGRGGGGGDRRRRLPGRAGQGRHDPFHRTGCGDSTGPGFSNRAGFSNRPSGGNRGAGLARTCCTRGRPRGPAASWSRRGGGS